MFVAFLVLVSLGLACILEPTFSFSVNRPARRQPIFRLDQWENAAFERRTNVCMARAGDKSLTKSWFPPRKVYDDDIFAQDDETEEIEERSIELLAKLVERRISQGEQPEEDTSSGVIMHKRSFEMARGRFLDLTCTKARENLLERMFDSDLASQEDGDVVRGAVIALQSLLIMGTQVGVKGPPKQLQNMVAHLWRRDDHVVNGDSLRRDVDVWDTESVRRLKYTLDQRPGTQLLVRLLRKRSSQGAFDLLVELGAWEKHEDIALLRSGFPIRFTEAEEAAVSEAVSITHDPDAILGIRQDLRSHKIYTIDSASTTEIDDGLSVEVLSNADGSTRHRYWIHIADAERWAPRASAIFEVALRRATSLYLPSRTVPMFPPYMTSLMSLRTNRDLCALSLGVELLPDGSIDPSSIVVTPSNITVDYRLSYEDVDEMLEEGVGYSEEWELGELLDAATKRRNYRIENGSTEGLVPNPIPQVTVKAFPDKEAPDGVGIEVGVEAVNNSGMNQTEVAEGDANNEHAAVVSPAFLLVTEMMILAGEAIGKWKLACDNESWSAETNQPALRNTLKLPFRTQPKPDFKSRQNEVRILKDLREGMQGNGYCQAWYARRFFKPVQLSELSNPHYGLGLDCYVQWTSPIRRFSDLQVHIATKRYLRRQRVNELMRDGLRLPSKITETDLGCPVPIVVEDSVDADGRITNYEFRDVLLDVDLNFNEGIGLARASRNLQRQSQEYWVFEYLNRLLQNDPEDAVFDAVVLGCVNPAKYQYAIYVHELGLEHRYLSEVGGLRPGMNLSLRVASVSPRFGLLTFTLSNF